AFRRGLSAGCLPWGWSKALVPAVFGVTLSLILVELLLLNFRKIPFTCSYLPGKANITVFGVLYWLAFSTYAYTMAGAELWILREPILLVVYAALAFPALASLLVYPCRHLRQGFTCVFTDTPEPAARR